MIWYYVAHGEQIGPLDDDAFQSALNLGLVQPDTLVWNEQMADWLPYEQASPNTNTPTPDTESNPEVSICSECGEKVNRTDGVPFRGLFICAACKPNYFQRLRQGEEVKTDLKLAGFGRRFIAKLMDVIILGAVNMALAMLVSPSPLFGPIGPGEPADFSGFDILSLALSNLLSMALNLGFATYFIGRFGATPGKMALGMKVVRPDGTPLTYPRALGRAAAEILSGLICNLGYLMVLIDPVKRAALHDHICDTRVIQVEEN